MLKSVINLINDCIIIAIAAVGVRVYAPGITS